MQKFLVFTAPKIGGNITVCHIEDENAHGQYIEEYLDSMGDIYWAIFPATVPVDKAGQIFKNYVACRQGVI